MAIARYEIRVNAVDDQGDESFFIFWSMVGPDPIPAQLELDRVRRAMAGEEVGIFARFWQRAQLVEIGVTGVNVLAEVTA